MITLRRRVKASLNRVSLRHEPQRQFDGGDTSRSNELWYVDSGTSNHMMNHKEWFSTLVNPKQVGVIEIRDDTPQPIEHIGDVPLSPVSQRGIMRNVLHVSIVTKNLVLVGRIVDQAMQVPFTHLRCFIEEEGKSIAQGCREGRMFILEANDVNTAMFTKGQKVESDIDLWHKRFSQVNFH